MFSSDYSFDFFLTWRAGLTAATVFKQEAAERLHKFSVGSVDQVATLTLNEKQVGAGKLLEVKAECGIRYAQLFDEF
jgi:hypothetical protein